MKFMCLELSKLIIECEDNSDEKSRLFSVNKRIYGRKRLAYRERVKTTLLSPHLNFKIRRRRSSLIHGDSIKSSQAGSSSSILTRSDQFNSNDTLIQQFIERIQQEGDSVIEMLQESFTYKELISSNHLISLEFFDNTEFELRSYKVLMSANKQYNIIFAYCFIPTLTDPEKYQWEVVSVLEYLKLKQRFLVKTLDVSKRIFELQRLFLMFRHEDSIIFKKRLRFALDFRQMCLSRLKYEYFLDNISLDNCFSDTTAEVNEMFSPTLICQMVPCDCLSEQILSELDTLWRRFLTDLSVQMKIKNEYGFYKKLERPNIEKISTYIQKPQFKKQVKSSKFRKRFNDLRQIFIWNHLYVEPEIYQSVKMIYYECEKVLERNLFIIDFPIPLILEEFEVKQNNNINLTIQYLQYNWTKTIVNILEKKLRHLNKGWFNIKVNNWQTYSISKLNRLMNLIQLHMTIAVRNLVLNSVNLLINRIEEPCVSFLDYIDTYQFDNDCLNPNYKNETKPIFLIFLQMTEYQACYSHDLIIFSEMFINQLNNAVIQSHGIKEIPSMLLKNLTFDKTLTLSSISLTDERIENLIFRFRKAYNNIIEPMIVYLRKFDQYVEFYYLNIDKYIENFQNQKLSSVRVKQEILMHFKHIKHIETAVPNTITMGPFLISIEALRNYLINKRKTLIDCLLKVFAENMKKSIEALLHSYENMVLTMSEKASTIEEIVELKNSIDQIPSILKTNEDLMKRYMYEYEVLIYFRYSLSDIEFNNKWTALAWPYKIRKQLESTNEFIISETDNLYKIQKSNETELSENIENLDNLTLENSIEGQRLWKEIQEAKEFGDLLIKRQDLFHVGLTPFDKIDELFKNLEPYKILWNTFADYLIACDTWMEYPLFNIDLNLSENEFEKIETSFEKLFQSFKEIPSVQKIIDEYLKKINDFKLNFEFVKIINSPEFSQSHWDAICKEAGVYVKLDSELNFKTCKNLNIINYVMDLKI